jgi:hypothetical protein
VNFSVFGVVPSLLPSPATAALSSQLLRFLLLIWKCSLYIEERDHCSVLKVGLPGVSFSPRLLLLLLLSAMKDFFV